MDPLPILNPRMELQVGKDTLLKTEVNPVHPCLIVPATGPPLGTTFQDQAGQERERGPAAGAIRSRLWWNSIHRPLAMVRGTACIRVAHWARSWPRTVLSITRLWGLAIESYARSTPLTRFIARGDVEEISALHYCFGDGGNLASWPLIGLRSGDVSSTTTVQSALITLTSSRNLDLLCRQQSHCHELPIEAGPLWGGTR